MPIVKSPSYDTSVKEFKVRIARNMRDLVIERLAYVGEQCVNTARNLPSPPASAATAPHQPNYIDWTANLRSSIGYVISVDGQVVMGSDFTPIKGGEEGAKQGKDYAHKLANEYPDGICLIVVAGMKYAKYVESKGYDVLDSAKISSEHLISQMLNDLIK